jgi:hypothetical protein
MVITLSACSTGPKGTEFQTVEHNGNIVILTFDYDEKTITASNKWNDTGKANEVYCYEYDGGNITITYPNGAVWIESPTSTGAVISWDDNYDPQRYIEGDVLARYLEEAHRPRSREGIVGIGFACLIMAAVGVVMFVVPEELIEMKYGWRFKNAEPTEFAIWEVRIGGIIVVVVAVVIFLIAAFA